MEKVFNLQNPLGGGEPMAGRGGVAIAVLFLFAAGPALLALPTGVSAPPSEPQVTDPEGDATENNSDMIRGASYKPCTAIWAGETCGVTVSDAWSNVGDAAGDALPLGVVPAPPAMDGTTAWFDDTLTDLLVHLQLAALESDYGGAQGSDPYEMAGYEVSWRAGPDGACVGSVALYVFPTFDRDGPVEGKTTLWSIYSQYDAAPTVEGNACSAGGGDFWSVP